MTSKKIPSPQKICYVWQCEKCGRIGIHKFEYHAPSKDSEIGCWGKVKKIKLENIW
jgi:hypothetical protein